MTRPPAITTSYDAGCSPTYTTAATSTAHTAFIASSPRARRLDTAALQLSCDGGHRRHELSDRRQALTRKSAQRVGHVDDLTKGVGQHQRGKAALQWIGGSVVLRTQGTFGDVLSIDVFSGNALGDAY